MAHKPFADAPTAPTGGTFDDPGEFESKLKLAHAGHDDLRLDKDESKWLATLSEGTRTLKAAENPEIWGPKHEMVTPICASAIYKWTADESGGELGGQFGYAREFNTTRDVLERKLAALENGKYGLVFASGMAAASAVMMLLNSGDAMIMSSHCYAGNVSFSRKFCSKFNIDLKQIDFDRIEDELRPALTPSTKLVWFDVLSNPLLKVADFAGIVRTVRDVNKDAIILCDNTFMSPVFQKPLDFGVDIVLHSITKYIGGHSDLLMGGVAFKSQQLYDDVKYFQFMERKALYHNLRFTNTDMGGLPSPFDCFLALRGIKTLPLRMERCSRNGKALARHLSNHQRVQSVAHPTIPSHPSHELWCRQALRESPTTAEPGCTGMLSLYLKDGTAEQTKTFVNSLRLFSKAVSLGGTESLVSHPFSMTHLMMEPARRREVGIEDNFVRFSLGLEDASDLISDIDQALAKAFE